jgi:hypothetical protein
MPRNLSASILIRSQIAVLGWRTFIGPDEQRQLRVNCEFEILVKSLICQVGCWFEKVTLRRRKEDH